MLVCFSYIKNGTFGSPEVAEQFLSGNDQPNPWFQIYGERTKMKGWLLKMWRFYSLNFEKFGSLWNSTGILPKPEVWVAGFWSSQDQNKLQLKQSEWMSLKGKMTGWKIHHECVDVFPIQKLGDFWVSHVSFQGRVGADSWEILVLGGAVVQTFGSTHPMCTKTTNTHIFVQHFWIPLLNPFSLRIYIPIPFFPP